jgi:MYXO-CTERM domain-containing protein
MALFAIPVAAQSFTNLNFESGLREQPFGPYSLPGWTVSPSFAGPHIGGNHHLWPAPAPPAWAVSSPFPQLANKYSLLMQIGLDFPDRFGNPGPLLVPSVSQTALVPVGMQSIRFRASNPDAHHLYYMQGPPFGDPEVYFPSQLLAWRLSVDGQTFPLHRLGNDFWGMNIPGLAGQVRTLSISMNSAYPLLPMIWFPEGYFDDISFSAQRIVPEPSSGALALLALSASAMIRRRSRSNTQRRNGSPKR